MAPLVFQGVTLSTSGKAVRGGAGRGGAAHGGALHGGDDDDDDMELKELAGRAGRLSLSPSTQH